MYTDNDYSLFYILEIMKKVLLSVVVALTGSLMTLPSVEAQNRGGRQEHNRTTVGQRPGRSGNGHGNTRPGNSHGNDKNRPSVQRPGQGDNSHGTVHKPLAPSYRPGASGGNHRPGHKQPGIRPSTPPPPAHNVRPHRPVTVTPPRRPGRPHYGGWIRPVPPRNWRPAYRRVIVPNILGMTFGLTINSALDYLYNGGYSVDGYGKQEVYLRNVNELGYVWDDATLYFGANGLVRSQFYDSSAIYSPSRYYNVYNSLTMKYGAPVSSSNSGTLSATWFGYNGDYITLQYTMMDSSAGYRYFTVLTCGN